MQQTFEQWQADVNACLELLCGLGVECLPDWDYRDGYERNMKPAAAARKVIANARDC